MQYHLGLESTDSIAGGCTTWTFSKILDKLIQFDPATDFYDYPRLIRLNPNIPFKTRGNAALSVNFDNSLNISEIMDICISIIEEDICKYQVDDKKPGLILTTEKPTKQNFYQEALQYLLSMDQVKSEIKNCKIWPDFNQAHIGAYSAINSNLDYDYTFELIAYRKSYNFGKLRVIDTLNVKELDSKYSTTFSSIDITSNRELICPSGPDPIFCGIRGEKPEDLLQFFYELNQKEEIDSWTIFKTNQATNAHVLIPQNSLIPFAVFSCHALVTSNPVVFHGGHVKIKINIDGKLIDCMVFEPTKKLRSIANKLIPGDRLFIHGNVRENDHGLHIAVEYFFITHLAANIIKIAPKCNCGKRMTGAGKYKGYKCKTCKKRRATPKYKESKRNLFIGQKAYSSLSAQRHLTRPSKRLHIRNRQSTSSIKFDDFRSKLLMG